MQNKLFLRELRSVKDNGEFVSVTFTNGLNVISGISNTGKSYILQCFPNHKGLRCTAWNPL